jgi:transcriptional regulator
LLAFIAKHPLATLVANTAQGLTANHIPLLWHSLADGSNVLRGHIARANTIWRTVDRGASVLAIFTGADHYISPTWYPSKRDDGKVVPTWNYAAVHVRWHVSDAPASYIDAMLRAIVGFEINVTGLEGKFKGSQNRSVEDRANVARSLQAAGSEASAVGELVPGVDP